MQTASNDNTTSTVYDKNITDFVRKTLNSGKKVEMDEERKIVLHSLDGLFEDWILEGIVVQKKCTKCREQLALYDFGPDKEQLDEYDNFCIKCRKENPKPKPKPKPKSRLPKSKYWDNYKYTEDLDDLYGDSLFERRPPRYRYKKGSDVTKADEADDNIINEFEPWNNVA